MATKLDYNNGEHEVPQGSFRISASSFHKFFSKTSQWYNENVLETSVGFEGSTASVLGTCVHFFSQDFHTNQTVNYEEIERYIDEQSQLLPTLDTQTIRNQYPIMGQALLQYLEHSPSHKVEEFLYQEILPNIGVGGSCDSLVDLNNGTYKIRDWKTTSATSLPSSITYEYKLQLLIYAYLYSQQGIPVSEIEIVYITRNTPGKPGKPNAQGVSKIGKAYPCEVVAITEPISKFDLDFIQSLIQLCAESVDAFIQYPNLRHIISQDLRNRNAELPLKLHPITAPQVPLTADDI